MSKRCPGYHGRPMDIVLTPKICTEDTWCRMGPRPIQQPNHADYTEEETWQPLRPHPSSKSLAKGDVVPWVSVYTAYPGYCFSASVRSCICPEKCKSRTMTLGFRQLLKPFFFHFSYSHTACSTVLCPRSTAQHLTFADKQWCQHKLFKTVLVPTLSFWIGKKSTFVNSHYS